MPVLYGVEFEAAVNLKDIIGGSSQVVAACRASESERVDALFVDPLAKYFAGAAREGLPEFLNAYTAVRTHFIDMELMDALTQKHAEAPPNAVVPDQIVLLGAGMDARMWRLPPQEGARPPAETLFELDQKEVLKAKETILAGVAKQGKLPTPKLAKKRVTLSVDIREPDWIKTLNKAGYDRARGTVWILEGFLRFFSNVQIDELIAQLALHSACGSSILVTVPSETNRRAKAKRDPADAEYQWRFGTDDPVGYFTRFGWRTVKHACVEELERQYNRVPRLANADPSDVSAYVTEGDRMVGGNYLLRALKVA